MKISFAAICLAALLLVGCAGSSGRTVVPPDATVVGALLEQSGTLTDFTPEFTAAYQLAVEDENARLAAAGSLNRFALKIRDTQSTNDGAEAAMNGFVADGVKFVIGPRTSAQCQRILPIAAENDIAVVATRSVADELSIPNDPLFRLIAPDREVISLVAQEALSRGMTKICVLYRNDVFGTNALQIMTDSMRASGGDVVYSQAYNPAAAPSDAELQTFADAVIAQKAIHGAETGIAYFGLTELVGAFARLNAQPDSFRSVGAVASQSLANIPSMLTNEQARAYAVASTFEAVAFALASQPAKSIPAGSALLSRIAARSGRANPDELSINVYDGMRAILRAAQRGGGAVAAMKQELASNPAGTVGTMQFDANGDRIGEFYGIYRIDATNEPMWVRVRTLTH